MGTPQQQPISQPSIEIRVPGGHPQPIVVRARRGRPIPLVLHQDGTLFTYSARFVGGEWVAYADCETALVEALMCHRGYHDLSEFDQDVARIGWAMRQAVIMQAEMNAYAMTNGDWDRCTPEQQRVLTHVGRETPDLGGADWEAPVPLMLISTAFQPYGGGFMPDGNVVEIDPGSDLGLISSLANARAIDWWIATVV